MSDTPGPWSPYRAMIEDHIETCTNHLGRLRCPLDSEIAPDHHYLADKPTSRTPPPAGWCPSSRTSTAGSATAARPSSTHDADGTRFVGECSLPDMVTLGFR